MNEGRVTVRLSGREYRGKWRVVGGRVEAVSEFGADSALLGPLASAPDTVAREKLVEMAKRASRPERAAPAQPQSSMRDMMRWRP